MQSENFRVTQTDIVLRTFWSSSSTSASKSFHRSAEPPASTSSWLLVIVDARREYDVSFVSNKDSRVRHCRCSESYSDMMMVCVHCCRGQCSASMFTASAVADDDAAARPFVRSPVRLNWSTHLAGPRLHKCDLICRSGKHIDHHIGVRVSW